MIKAKVSKIPRAPIPSVSGLVHPKFGASIIAYRIDTRAPIERSEPMKSRGRS